MTSNEPQNDPSTKPRKPRKWRRRLLWCGATLLVLLAIFRLSLPWLLPWTLRKVSDGYDLACTYDRLELSLHGADAELWHLTVAPKEGGEPYFHAEYCRADLSTPQLLLGRIVVRRLEADGVDLLVERDKDGALEILKRIEKARSKEKPAAPAPPQPAPPEKPRQPPGEIDLTPPVVVDAMRLQHLHAVIRDKSVAPPFETRFNMNVRLSDLASGDRPARFEIEASSPPVLDSFTIEGEGSSVKTDLKASCLVELKGLHLEPLAGYLEPLGVRPIARDVSFRARAKIETKANPLSDADRKAKVPGTLSAAIDLQEIALRADDAESMALDTLTAHVGELGWAAVHVKEVILQGQRIAARKTPEGLLRAAGFELVPRPAPGPGAATQPPASPPPPVASPVPAPAPAPGTPPPAQFRARLDLFAVRDVRASFRDESVSPPANLALQVEDFSVRNIVFDPDRPDAPVEIAGKLSVPDMVKEARLEGQAVPFAKRKTVDLKVSATGIVPAAIEPYLKPAGIESLLENGSFSTSLSAQVESTAEERLLAELTLGKTTYGDKDAMLELGGLRVQGVNLDSKAGMLDIGEISLSGPKLAARRNAAGAIEALGFRIGARKADPAQKPPVETAPKPSSTNDDLGQPVPAVARGDTASAAPAVKSDAETPASSAPKPQALKIRIGRIAWKDFAARFVDEAIEPSVTAALEELGVELGGMTIDLSESPASGVPGQLNASLRLPGVAENVRVTGTVLPQPAQGSVQLAVAVTGMTAKVIAPYLKAAGLEPELKEGSLDLSLAADYKVHAGAVTANTAVTGVAYRDGPNEIAGLDALRVSGLEAGARGLKIASIEVEKPRTAVSRDSGGVIHAAGFSVAPPAPRVTRPEEPAPAEGAPPKPKPATPSAPAEPAAEPFSIELASFALRNARLGWQDAVPSHPVATALHSAVELEGLVIGREAEPARLKAHVSAEGVIDDIATTGSVALLPRGPKASIEVDGRGIKAGPLAAYFPPGVTSKLTDGRLKARVEAAISSLDSSGQSVALSVTGVDFREGVEPEAFVKLGSFRVVAPRIDPEGGRVDIDEISLKGFETGAQLAAEGAVQALGLSITPPPEKPVAPGAVQAESKPQPAKPEPTAVAQAASPPALRPRKLPLVTIKTLDLNLDRLAVADARNADGKPIVTALRLASTEPIALLGEDPEAQKPIQLALTGKVDPLVDSMLVAFKLSPFTKDPELDVIVDVQGIQGKDLTAILPALKEKLDGKGLADGRFQSHVSATLKLDRHNPVDFDLSKGFAASLLVEKVAFTNPKDGPVLLGLEGLSVELARMDPKTGAVHVKELEIQKPIANVKRTAEGLEILGLVIKLPKPEEKPATTETATPAPETTAVQPVAAAPSAPPQPPAEVRLDKLFASGLDVRVSDSTTDPPTHLWLNGLDVDVRSVTSRILTEPVSTRFQVSVQAGKVPLPVALKGSLIGGVLGDAAAVVSGQGVDTTPKFEEREVFEDIILKGKLGLFPNPTGWIQAKVSALDLNGLRGLAAQSGVRLESGVFEEDATIRLPGDGSAELGSRSRFTDLSMTEPPNGPITRYLGLPTPVDQVVFLLRDNEGTVTIPFSVSKQPGAFGGSDVASILWAIPKTLGQVIATAILSSPLRVAGTVTDLMPFGGPAEKKPEEPILLEFAPGDAHLGPTEALRLAPLLERLRSGEPLSFTIAHEFGAGDLRRSELRGNPSVEECLELGARLRTEKAALLRERDAAAAQARAAVVSGLVVEAPLLTEKLRALDQQVAGTDLALEQVYGLTRPGAERLAPRRTRDAALALARLRVDEVKAVFLSSGVPGVQDVVKAPKPGFSETAPEGNGKVRITIAPRK